MNHQTAEAIAIFDWSSVPNTDWCLRFQTSKIKLAILLLYIFLAETLSERVIHAFVFYFLLLLCHALLWSKIIQ